MDGEKKYGNRILPCACTLMNVVVTNFFYFDDGDVNDFIMF